MSGALVFMYMNRDWRIVAGVPAGAAERVETGFAAGVFTGTEDSSQEFYQNLYGILFLIHIGKENKERLAPEILHEIVV